MRAFVAINLPDDLKRSIANATRTLQSCGADVKWVTPANLHLTLMFLGDTPQASIKPMQQALEAALTGTHCAPVTLAGVGAFPNARHPKVVWIGLSSKQEGYLQGLALATRNALVPLGAGPDDKPFKAHLTLGRVRSMKGADALVREMENLRDVEFGGFTVERVAFMQSDLQPAGPRYTEVFGVRLR